MKFTAKLSLMLMAAVLGLSLISPLTAVVAASPEARQVGTGLGQSAAGAFSAHIDLGGGFTFRALVTIHADGVMTSQDVTDFGSATLASADGPHLNTLATGSWNHTSGRSYVATLIFFRSAVGSGEIDSLGRITLTGTFDEGFNTVTGDAIAEVFPCVPASIGCPEPTLLPPPTAPSLGTVHMARITP